MPLYEYACRKCGYSEDRLQRDLLITCPDCQPEHNLLKRQWGFAIKESWQPHFNHSVGQYVATRTDFNDALKRGGEKAGSTYTPIEHGDLPKSEEGMETTNRIKHDMGIK